MKTSSAIFFLSNAFLCAACIFIHLAVLEYHNRIWRRIYFSTPSIEENSIRISKASYITWLMRNIDIVVSIRSVYFLQTAKKNQPGQNWLFTNQIVQQCWFQFILNWIYVYLEWCRYFANEFQTVRNVPLEFDFIINGNSSPMEETTFQ